METLGKYKTAMTLDMPKDKSWLDTSTAEESVILQMALETLDLKFTMLGVKNENVTIRFVLDSKQKPNLLASIEQTYLKLKTMFDTNPAFKKTFQPLIDVNTKLINEISKTDYHERVRSN